MSYNVEGKHVKAVREKRQGWQGCSRRCSLPGIGAAITAGETEVKEMLEANVSGQTLACAASGSEGEKKGLHIPRKDWSCPQAGTGVVAGSEGTLEQCPGTLVAG